MPDFTITSRSNVKATVKRFDATHLLSLVDPHVCVYTPWRVFGNHLTLHMTDDDHPAISTAPKLDQIKVALNWGKQLPADARVVVHCEAGVCRSTAMALGLWVQSNPNKSLADGKDWLKQVRPMAVPNMLIAKHIDDILNLNGDFVKVCDDIGAGRVINIINGFDDDGRAL